MWIADTGIGPAAEGHPNKGGHGSSVWSVYEDCTAATVNTDQYFESTRDQFYRAMFRALSADGRDAIESVSRAGSDIADHDNWQPVSEIAFGRRNSMSFNADHTGQRILQVQSIGNTRGEPSGAGSTLYQRDWENALWIGVSGWLNDSKGDDDESPSGLLRDRAKPKNPYVEGNHCEPMQMLCVVAPFGVFYRDITFRDSDGKYYYANDDRTLSDRERLNLDGTPREHTSYAIGTSISAPHVAAALDSIWVVWPNMDILDLRNLAFDCAKNMPVGQGETVTEYTFSYTNGRKFTSKTTPAWGHGMFDLECMFTPNGGLQDPTTGEAMAGGIIGPMNGAVVSAFLTGQDYTGRDFGYGFARPVARENFALLANANLSNDAGAAVNGPLLANRSGSVRLDLTAAGNAMGASASLATRTPGGGALILRTGLVMQPEGAGSLEGSRSFRAPSTLSTAISAVWGAGVPVTAFTGRALSFHIQADHWRTVAAVGRSMWQDAQLRESRLSASLVKRIGKHEISLVGQWQSGLDGALQVNGREWAVNGAGNSGVQFVWRMKTR